MRIIGGELRGRRLAVPDQYGLRPTSDRIRETLFNWLAPRMIGTHCLDAFAGSGALGFESISRGAAHVVLLEQSRAVVRHLHSIAHQFGCTPTVTIHHTDTLQWLAQQQPIAHDIIFLDPPFADQLLTRTCALLTAGWVHSGSQVYIEAPRQLALSLPDGWEWRRQQCAGQVQFGLVVVN